MSTQFGIANRVHWQLKNELVYILADGSDEVVELNTTASFVWLLLAKPHRIDQLAHAVHTQFAVPYETALTDVTQLIESLKKEKLVVKKR